MKISVCLASYNGERFISEQIQSILQQLSPTDELIISDDCSTDSTISIINGLSDHRIILLTASRKRGHVLNFQNAIQGATGDIIFLSDQDDIWCAGKIRKILAEFGKDKSISAVYHGLELIDEDGHSLGIHYGCNQMRKYNGMLFSLSHIYKGRIFGCSVAFRSNLLKILLPFPILLSAHDHWVGIAGGVYGKIIQVPEFLVFYRQHDQNLTPKVRMHFYQIVKNRLTILFCIFIAIKRRLMLSFEKMRDIFPFF